MDVGTHCTRNEDGITLGDITTAVNEIHQHHRQHCSGIACYQGSKEAEIEIYFQHGTGAADLVDLHKRFTYGSDYGNEVDLEDYDGEYYFDDEEYY